MSDKQEALQTKEQGNNRSIVTHAVLVGLTPLIPVPILDDVVKGYFRRRMVRGLSAAQGRVLSDVEMAALTSEGGGGCLRGCAGTLVVYPLKKVFRKVFYFLEWKRAVDLTSQTYHYGYLVNYALQPRAGGATLMDLRPAAEVGRAIDAVCREAPIKPVESAVSGTFRKSKRVIGSAADLLGRSLRRLSGRASEREVERAVEEIEPEEERELAPVVARLQNSIASVPEEHFRRLRDALDGKLKVDRRES